MSALAGQLARAAHGFGLLASTLFARLFIVHVPLHFLNQDSSVGAKKGGVVTHNLVDIEVVCLPAHLPEFIEVDLAKVDVGQSVHLSELKLPPGVQIVELMHGADHDQVVAAIQAGRIAGESAESEG